QTFSLGIDLTEETLFFTLTLQEASPVQLPKPLTNVWIDSVTGMIGVDWDKEEANLGFAAKFAIAEKAPSGQTPSTYTKGALTSLMPTQPGPPNSVVPWPVQWECALVAGIDELGVVDPDLVLLQATGIPLVDLCNYLLPPPPQLPSDFANALN